MLDILINFFLAAVLVGFVTITITAIFEALTRGFDDKQSK